MDKDSTIYLQQFIFHNSFHSLMQVSYLRTISHPDGQPDEFSVARDWLGERFAMS